MLKLGVDELTLVLQVSKMVKQYFADNNYEFVWHGVAEDIIDDFARLSNLQQIFGRRIFESRPPQGYTTAYTYGEHSFYLAIAYHKYMMNMGIIVKFSAQALDYYCEQSGIKVYEFIKKIQSATYTARLSRIDLTADFIDEDIDVTSIYNDLMHKRIGLFRQSANNKTGEIEYKWQPMKYEGYLKETEVPTIYIGSVQSKSRLRIYDKKREQIERKGSKYDKALLYRNWVRFEGVFRQEYAHQLTEALTSVGNDTEFTNLIACTLVQKYGFRYIDGGAADRETEYTQLIIDCITNGTAALRAPSSRNNDLLRSIEHILGGSGMITVLYKIKKIWGIDAVSDFLDFLKDYVNEYEPNEDCRYWLRKNAQDYLLHFPQYNDFKMNAMIPTLMKGGIL